MVFLINLTSLLLSRILHSSTLSSSLLVWLNFGEAYTPYSTA